MSSLNLPNCSLLPLLQLTLLGIAAKSLALWSLQKKKQNPKKPQSKPSPTPSSPEQANSEKWNSPNLETSVNSGVGGLQANVELLRGLGLVSLLRRIHKGAFQEMAEVPAGPGGGERICIISQDLGWLDIPSVKTEYLTSFHLFCFLSVKHLRSLS